MEYVKIPFHLAHRAAKIYRPLMPYVRKFIAENRPKTEVKTVEVIQPQELGGIEDFIKDEFSKVKSEFEAKSKAELVEIAKNNGIEKAERFTKEKLINKILGQE